MSKQAYLFLDEDRPHSAPGAINHPLEQELRALGYGITRHGRHRMNARDAYLPLGTAGRLLSLRSAPMADLAIHCDMGLWIHPPSRQLARKTAVLFHGLYGAPTTWLANPTIDQYWGLSPYIQEVATSLLSLPDLRRGQCLEPRAPRLVDYLVPPLPCLEAPPARVGLELPPEILESLERGDVLGHALQSGKPDWMAVCSILLNLNGLAQEHGDSRRFRLVVTAEDFSGVQLALKHNYPVDTSAFANALAAFGFKLEDLLVPTPFLHQQALFQLFEAARFGLSYNTIAEAFGLYVLESVLNGCPVYTNGVGNNRFALPPGHGINVLEDADMAFGDPGAYAQVAARIYQDVAHPESQKEACRRGAALISRTFTREALATSLKACLARLDTEQEPLAFEQLEVRVSPLVRLLDEPTGRVVSDYLPVELSPAERTLVREAPGQTAGALVRGAGEDTLARLQGLFDKGVLSLDAPASARAHQDTSRGAWPWYRPVTTRATPPRAE